jgi:hypothetical protein
MGQARRTGIRPVDGVPSDRQRERPFLRSAHPVAATWAGRADGGACARLDLPFQCSARTKSVARLELSMKTDTLTAPCWSTASFGGAVATSPMELSALGEHLQHCTASHGHLVRLRCLAESMNGFVTARFVTTLALLAVPIVVIALLL